MNDDRLVRALRSLAEQDALREAPARVETRLLEAIRRRRRAKVLRRSAIAATVLIGFGIAAVSSGLRSSHPVVAERPVVVAAAPQSTLPPPPATKAIRKRAPHPAPAKPPAKEVATDFFPLVDAPPPFERGELVRVLLPASAMRAVGLPVREDRLADPVQADVLIGEEGMARAIRFVSFEQ